MADRVVTLAKRQDSGMSCVTCCFGVQSLNFSCRICRMQNFAACAHNSQNQCTEHTEQALTGKRVMVLCAGRGLRL